MGTKWKSSVAILMTCTTLFTFGMLGIFLLANYGYDFAHKDYFHTPDFQHNEINKFTSYFTMFELNTNSLTEAKKRITVSEEEIEEHRYRYGDLPMQLESIQSRYEVLIQNALEVDNQEVADAHVKERDAKLEDITKNFESDEHVEAKILEEKEKVLEDYYKEREQYKSRYNQLKDSFLYYFKDNHSGKVYTNVTDSEETSINAINQSNTLYSRNVIFGSWSMIDYEITGSDRVQSILHPGGVELEGKIGIPKTLPDSSHYMDQFNQYKKEQLAFWSVIAASILSLFLSLIIFKKARKSRAEMKRWKKYYDKLPIDIRVLLLGCTLILTFILLVVNVQEIAHIPTVYLLDNIVGVIFLPIGMVFSLIQSVYLIETLKNWKNIGNEWKRSLTYRVFIFLKKYFLQLSDKLKEAFIDQSTGTQIILLFGMVFVLGLAALLTEGHPLFVLFYILLLGGVGIPLALLIINKIGDFNRIAEYIHKLATGNLTGDLHIKGDSVLAKLAKDINVLKQGVKQSQNEQAKSERLKTELITNVSHDLRTPLTSIITYTELLKEQGLGEEESAYLEIIDRKSKRLKVLIDDLFEVSKMASGNIELRKERVDLVQLLQQALGEYDDIIKESSLHFRVTHDDPPINAVVDGQKLWRVFDNLIGNSLKYSLENSRVYITLSIDKKSNAIITFKNVSKYELHENTDELFERFKRGDTSRHTDGSGLGLAIAQSIVELHEGDLEIEIDGDLFKVTISLPLLN